ncbi:protein canopy 4 [Condylostylus longicornis]|uniref:protein canopy 4 n=1 Tax=Condylostylus longicornis TaxID=2530218 RepID=UPI00244E0956|nr:protein canopy 4 [Condylostylus longicornis]
MLLKIFLLLYFSTIVLTESNPEEKQGVIYPNRCEVCKILAIELQDRLAETGKSSDVLEIGYSLDDVKPKKRTEYRTSELRLIESLDNICERILEYNLHKERGDSTRFAKGMPQTFKALHGLVDKGVKVELGIPYELWDKPPVEVAELRRQCEVLLEDHEETIEDWYYKHQDTQLIDYLCEQRVLKPDEKKCLKEVLDTKGDKGKIDDNSPKIKQKEDL